MAIKPTNQLGTNSLIDNGTKLDLDPKISLKKSKQKPQGKTVYFDKAVLEKIAEMQDLLDINNFSYIVNLSALIFFEMVNDKDKLIKINTELSNGFTIEHAIKNVLFNRRIQLPSATV